MVRISIAVIAAGMVALVPQYVAGQQQSRPRACQQSPALPEHDPGVIFRDPSFDHAQTRHTLKTFSESAPSGETQSEYCFRYEVENAGQQDVRNLQWGLAGIWADPLVPGTPARRKNVKRRQILDAPLDVDNRINTFENTIVMTRAHADRRDQQANQSPSRPQQMAILSPDQVLPQLASWLTQSNLPTGPVVARRLTEATNAPYRLTDQYNGPGFEIATTSTVQRTGQVVQIETSVTVTGVAAGAAQYAMPALYAMQRPLAGAGDISEYARFLSRFRELSKQFDPNKNVWSFRLSLPAEALNQGAVYQMRHPLVRRSTAGAFDCVMVESYSPLAVNFALPQCPAAPIGAQ